MVAADDSRVSGQDKPIPVPSGDMKGYLVTPEVSRWSALFRDRYP